MGFWGQLFRLMTFQYRWVVLVMHDDRLVITRAYRVGSVWVARWIGLDDCWSILNEDGSVTGTIVVKRWKKLSGWPETKKEPNE